MSGMTQQQYQEWLRQSQYGASIVGGTSHPGGTPTPTQTQRQAPYSVAPQGSTPYPGFGPRPDAYPGQAQTRAYPARGSVYGQEGTMTPTPTDPQRERARVDQERFRQREQSFQRAERERRERDFDNSEAQVSGHMYGLARRTPEQLAEATNYYTELATRRNADGEIRDRFVNDPEARARSFRAQTAMLGRAALSRPSQGPNMGQQYTNQASNPYAPSGGQVRPPYGSSATGVYAQPTQPGKYSVCDSEVHGYRCGCGLGR